ncbi:ABC transporter permease [Maribellus maritimus]|uniref:ABC transporter permease n=1 Tax=Maribellus maritimus TaxID=2870838 RepID=UPI001EEA2186|nr:ABC transporter permease [Maribellus maritimus]MCG6189790.1 ABC transporter permease [Maribellus maritimus]
MIRFKIKLAIRNLLKKRLYSALIIGGFSIGFTACILIGLFFNAEHNVNTHFKDYNDIYQLYDAKQNMCNLDYELYPILNKQYPEIENACPMEYSSNFLLIIKDEETRAYTSINHIIGTSNSFFDIFSTSVIASLSEKPFSDLNSAVITESVAKRLYGDKNPLGQTLVNDFFSATISAVIKDIPDNSSFKAELLLNAENKKFRMSMSCDDGKCINPTNHILLLKNQTNPVYFAEKLNQTIGQFNPNTDSLALQNLSDIYLSPLTFKSAHAKGNPKILIVFLSIAILIILLSSINYLNYTISMQYAKMKEIGINKTNGADRSQLLMDSFIEVTLGVLISLIISALLTTVLLPYSQTLFGREIHLSDISFTQLAPVFSGTLIAIILLNSLAPIYILSRFRITEFLSGGRNQKGKQIGKQAMLTFQLMVSIALIAVVMLIFKQLQYVKHYDLGFNEEQLVRLELPDALRNPVILKEESKKLPFVIDGTLSAGYPGWIQLSMGSGIEDNNFKVNCISIAGDYLETMGIQLLDGRNFLPGDKNKACLVNEKAFKQFGWKSIENKKYNNGAGYNVVGVVKDFNVKSLHNETEPLALLYEPDHDFNTLSLRLAPGNTGQQIQQITEIWKKLLPDEPMEFAFYDDQFQAMYVKEEKLAQSITFFSIVAIVLTCMGILGQIFLISLNRTKEIGVRKVNGAKVSEILILLNKDFIIWVLIAFILASPVAWFAMNKWLENFAYKTNLSWWIFVLAGVMTMGIALLTVSWQSWRAATRNPVEALRYE